MYRSFQSSVQTLHPDAVFILGDLFDEGKWATSDQWERYVKRAQDLFHISDVPLHVIAGNHDIGFHYSMTEEKLRR